MKNLLYLFFLLCSLGFYESQTVRVIDNKGTLKDIDQSKWALSGTNISNKNSGNVGIGTNNPTALLHINSTSNPAFRLVDGTQGLGKVLTSDANGNTIWTGVSSLGSITLSTGTTGTAPSWSSSPISLGGNTQLNIPFASSSSVTAGLLSNTDYTTFNNKIGVVTASTSAAVSTSGTTATIQNATAYWNANQLQGRNIANTAPIDGQVLTWDATSSTWKPSTIGVFSVVTVSGTTYTLTATDHGKILDFTSNSAVTITVPNSLPIGFQISITQAGTGQVTISGSGGMVVNNRWNGTRTTGRWAKAGLEVRATNSSVLSGDVQ